MPLSRFCCSLCGKCAPKKYLAHGKFEQRMEWLRKHRKKYHPGEHRKSGRKAKETKARKRSHGSVR